MDLGLDGRTALVTGGGGRLGSTDCRRLAVEGADVVVLDEVLDDAEAVVGDIADIEAVTGEAVAVECDLTDRGDVSATIEGIRSETGGVDVLVNNAGIVDDVATVEDFPNDRWDRDLAVTLTGTYNVTREVFPAMCDRGWGRVVTMSSIAGTDGMIGQLSSATTTAGLIGFARTLALEGAGLGVTSNVVAPSIVAAEVADLPPEQLEEVNPQWERIREATPMMELGRESDVAPLTAFLASEHARYVTGQVIGVTGGADLFTV